MRPSRLVGLCWLLMIGVPTAGRAGEISFRGAIVVPTNSVQIDCKCDRGGGPAPATRTVSWHTAVRPQDPELLAYAIRRAPGGSVRLVTVTYL